MDKDELLHAFQAYLDQAEDNFAAGEDTDLYSLFTEMAALRNEVKTESRQFKSALEDFKDVFGTMQGAHDSLSKSLAEQRKQSRDSRRAMLLDILDVFDRMEAGLRALENYHAGFWSSKSQTAFIEGIREGHGMTLRRLLQTLARHGVQPLDAVGKAVDPHSMRVVETVSDPDYAHASVVEELRKGFLWENEVLRLAEVKANKLTQDL